MPAREPFPVLTILGSGTLVPHARHHSSSHHLRLPEASVLLDCGPGTAHGFAEHGVPWQELTHIAVSHFHNDHFGDLAAILVALKHGLAEPRTKPLTLLGPVGFSAFSSRLLRAVGGGLLEPGFEVRVVEVAAERPYEDTEAGFTLSCHPTPHTDESQAYRLHGPWGTLGYTGDTGPSDEVAGFLDGCGVLVAECNLPDAHAIETHLSPSTLAALAQVARPELLVVVHVSPLHSPYEAVRHVSERYDGVVVAGVDGLRVTLGRDGPAVDPTTKDV